MNILTRYIIREFLKPLLFSTTAFGGLVLISEFFRELNYYLEKKASFIAVIGYLLLNLPWWCIQVLPVSVLLAVLFSLGAMGRSGEITAMKAAGINIWRLVVLFMLCALGIGLLELTLREQVIPVTVKYAEKIRQEKINKEKITPQAEFTNLIIAVPPSSRITVGRIQASTGMMQQVVLDTYDDDFSLRSQMVAESGRWQDGSWVFHNGVERTFADRQLKETSFTDKAVPLPFKPGDFIIERRRPEQMSSRAFAAYIRQLETLGIPAEKEKIQFQVRFSSVVSHVVVMLIGIPFALGMGAKHGKILSFTFALIFSFIFWGFQAIGQSLGEIRVIPPWFAAWIGNIVFGAIGVYLTSKIRK